MQGAIPRTWPGKEGRGCGKTTKQEEKESVVSGGQWVIVAMETREWMS